MLVYSSSQTGPYGTGWENGEQAQEQRGLWSPADPWVRALGTKSSQKEMTAFC